MEKTDYYLNEGGQVIRRITNNRGVDEASLGTLDAIIASMDSTQQSISKHITNTSFCYSLIVAHSVNLQHFAALFGERADDLYEINHAMWDTIRGSYSSDKEATTFTHIEQLAVISGYLPSLQVRNPAKANDVASQAIDHLNAICDATSGAAPALPSRYQPQWESIKSFVHSLVKDERYASARAHLNFRWSEAIRTW